MTETVKIYLEDQDGDPIVGVLVRVFDGTGATFITQQTTSLVSGDAVADMDLEEGSYTIRMSKTGVAFDGSLGNSSKSPQLIVVDSEETNDFTVIGQTFVRPTATDVRLCRCSGFFRAIDGTPLVGMGIKFINNFSPTLIDGRAVMGEGFSAETDEDGYISVDLFRNGHYSAFVSSVAAMDDEQGNTAIAFPRYMIIPDASSANLPDLLFPVVSSVTFPVTSLTLAVYESTTLAPIVTATDGRVLTGAAPNDVIYSSSDNTVLVVSTNAMSVSIMGAGAGTATINVVRKDQSIVSIPQQDITVSSITITVT